MSDLLAHLTAAISDGGHGRDPSGYDILHTDLEAMHEADHDPAFWGAIALQHPHEANP